MRTSIITNNDSFAYASVNGSDGSIGGLLAGERFSEDSIMSSLNNFLQPILSDGIVKTNTGIMPPGVIALTNEFVVFERPPEYKNIFLCPRVVAEINDESLQEENILMFRVPIPWQLYIVHYNVSRMNGVTEFYTTDVRMHFMKSNMLDFNQEIFMATLPNFYANGNLCRPMFSTMDEIERYPKSIIGVIESAYDWIWNNGTNLDLTECIAQYYIQARNMPITDTVFGKRFSRVPHKVGIGSYYVMLDAAQLFLQEWEQYSLEEVCQLNWPTNSEKKNHSAEYRGQLIRYLPEYLIENGQEPLYESHYDEDEDQEYRCDPTENPDEYCDCMIPENMYNTEHFTKWLYDKIGCAYSAKDSFKNFVDLFEFNANNVSSRAWYKNMTSKVLLSA